ncbi:MAG: DUF1285 domain-containing protein [Pseudomonadaceae bacterium]|nr:DUF1285 domain-containing protein [Pseudomonadaceae bacterium]
MNTKSPATEPSGSETLNLLFARLEKEQSERSLPPVHAWQPKRNGQIDIRIASDGRWYHEGGEIKREAMVRLFSTILRRDPDGFVLVTPAERLLIEVEDAPFVAIDMVVQGAGDEQQLLFTTNVGEHVVACEEHALFMRAGKPYLHVRDGLNALLTRSVYYRLADLVCVEEGAPAYVVSRGCRFSLE